METTSPTVPKNPFNEGIQLLVVECTSMLNWYKIFEGATWRGKPIRVEQAEWDDISLVVYGDSNSVVTDLRAAKRPLPDSPQNKQRVVTVNFVLMRSVTRGIHNQDSRNLLFGFAHANVPCVNSIESLLMALDRPLMFGGLKKIQKKLGRKNFPLIEQNYYPSHSQLIITPDFPFVAKVGHAHAGYGKVKIKAPEEMQDFKSLAALHGDYVTLEPFVQWDFDMRIQKIGSHYRGFRRVSPNWKGNTGNASVIDDMEVTEQYKLWIDECSKMFGGLDICALDLLHSKETGKDYILELNDTAIGLVHKYEEEDMMQIRDIVITRMDEAYPAETQKSAGEEVKEDKEMIKWLQDQLSLSNATLSREREEKKELQNKLNAADEAAKKKKKGLFS